MSRAIETGGPTRCAWVITNGIAPDLERKLGQHSELSLMRNKSSLYGSGICDYVVVSRATLENCLGCTYQAGRRDTCAAPCDPSRSMFEDCSRVGVKKSSAERQWRRYGVSMHCSVLSRDRRVGVSSQSEFEVLSAISGRPRRHLLFCYRFYAAATDCIDLLNARCRETRFTDIVRA